jgi:hypothetical protein
VDQQQRPVETGHRHIGAQGIAHHALRDQCTELKPPVVRYAM